MRHVIELSVRDDVGLVGAVKVLGKRRRQAPLGVEACEALAQLRFVHLVDVRLGEFGHDVAYPAAEDATLRVGARRLRAKSTPVGRVGLTGVFHLASRMDYRRTLRVNRTRACVVADRNALVARRLGRLRRSGWHHGRHVYVGIFPIRVVHMVAIDWADDDACNVGIGGMMNVHGNKASVHHLRMDMRLFIRI